MLFALDSIDNDIIVGRSHLANRIELITPITLGTDDVMQVYFELANGQITPKKSMALKGTEVVSGDTWQVYRYDIPQSILSAVTSANATSLKVQFRHANIDEVEGEDLIVSLKTSAQVTLTLDAGFSPSAEDSEIILDQSDFDQLAGLINNKLENDFTEYTEKSTLDAEDFLAIYEGVGSNKRIKVGSIVTFALNSVEDLSDRLETVEEYVDQDVSIGSNPAFATPTVDGLTFRNNGQTSTIDYADAQTINNAQTHIDDTTIHFTKASIDPSDIGLGNVDNTSDADKPVSTDTQTALNGKQDTLVSGTNIKTINSTTVLGSGDFELIPASEKGAAGGVATLDGVTGKVPASQLPSFVDDLEEYADLASFPATGDSDKIYVAIDTGKIYRWSGSQYVEIAANEVNSVNSKTGVVTLVAGDLSTTAFNGRLTGATTVQGALDLVDDATAQNTPTVTSSFNGILQAEDDTVQKALDRLDDHNHTESDITDLDKYTQSEVDGFLAQKVDVNALSSTLILYPTTASADISGYNRLVVSVTDSDYNTTAVDIATGQITADGQLIASLAADAGLFIGNPGVINITTLGNIRKVGGNNNQNASFYYEVYKRNAGGTETLITTSDNTSKIQSDTYEEFFASALLSSVDFIATDRIVIKYLADVEDGVNASYEFQFGGSSPVRTLLPLPVNVTLQADKVFYDNTGQNLVATNVQTAINELDDLVEEGLTQVLVYEYTITDADDGSGGFVYQLSGESPVTGTITDGRYIFDLPTGIEYINGANRLSAKIDATDGSLKRLYYGADSELTEPSTTSFALEFAFADNDVVYVKLYQSLATVSLNIADGSVTEGKIANSAVTTNKIANNAVDLTKVQQIPTNTILGNDTVNTTNVKALTVAEAKVLLQINNVDNTTDLNKPISSNTQTALDLKADKTNVLELDNTTAFTPDADYEPATKKYVDDEISGSSITSINDIGDVVITDAADGESLVYNGNNWVNLQVSGVQNVDAGTATTVFSVADINIDGGNV